MENIIDRKSYRRSNETILRKKDISEEIKSKGKFLDKIINSMLLLIFILLLKLFGFECQFEYIEEKINNGYSYEEVYNYVQVLISDYYDIKSNKISDIEINQEELIQNEYITDVEGVNQLMDDAKVVNDNYKLVSPISGTITSFFGCRSSDNPIVGDYHTGIDIAANTGTSIFAAHDGVITFASESGSYGNCITIESGDLKTLYAHCSKILVKNGDNVKCGQKIGLVGMTGNATGAHLHFEVRLSERFLNPLDVIDVGEKIEN